MKRSKFRFLSVIICTLFILTLMPIISPQITQAITSGDYEYTVSGNNAIITKYTGLGGNITIPLTIDGNMVTGIGDRAFTHCTNLISVTLPNSIISIGNDAFDYCTKLTGVIIPTSVTSIGNSAFYCCTSLMSVTISNSVTNIGYGAFGYCTSLTNMVIPNSITSIGYGMFSSCTSLINVTIPNSITNIDDYAFSKCKSLTSVIIPDSVASIGDNAFSSCTSLANVTIPNSVTSIGYATFFSCTRLTTINVGDQNIAYSSMEGVLYDKLKTTLICYPISKLGISFTVPDSVAGIGDGAFEYCASLASVIIPNSITSIGDNAFSNCTNLINVIIPNSVISISDGAFHNCNSLKSVTIPSSVTGIEHAAFSSCTSLTSVTIPNSVTVIGSFAFSSCTSLTSVTIPNGITNIDADAFSSCTSLTSVIIPNSVTNIGYQAFSKCTNLKSVNIPKSVRYIGELAFDWCTGLTDLTISKGVIIIRGGAFRGCSSLKSVTIPDSVTTIGELAFYSCASLTNVIIPNSVTSIGTSAFSDCTSLMSVTIPNSINQISDRTFYSCTSLTSVTIPISVISIGYSAFEYCKSLTSVEIPSSVAKISSCAFYRCLNLTGVKFLGNAPGYMDKDIFYTFASNFKIYYLYGKTGFTNPWYGYPTEPVYNTTYNVTYNGNGSNGGTAITDSKTYLEKAEVTVLGNSEILTKTNYTFAGWNTKADGSGTDYVVGATLVMGIANVTLYAQWAINANIMNFDSDGGSPVACQTVEYNGKATAPSDPTKTGYAFVGWHKEAGCITAWNFTTDKVTANTTLYAKWTINNYTVTFDSQGGSTVSNKSSDYNSAITAPTVPTKLGYAFVGWYKEAGCITAWNFTTDKVSANTILYAKWTIDNYTVTFNSQGGSTVSNKSSDYNSAITAPTVPIKLGYAFVGWYKEAGCITAWNFTTDKVSANTILYAKWTINNYTVTFNSQSGSTVSSKSVDYNSIITAPAVPTKLGYAFVGWYKEAGCITVWNFTTDKVTANTTLYAKWTINNYTVTFDSQGGSTVSIKSSDYNSEITAPTVPTKLGYAFVGWYKEAGCITAWNFTTDKVSANTILYAKWTINNYTVTFDSQGGSTLSNKSADYNSAIISPTAPTKTGYTFGGWYKETGCINTWDFTTNKVTANTTLYAKWTMNNYMVTFNSQGGSTLISKSADYNDVITTPGSPTKTGYIFGGWYKEAGGLNAWEFITDKVIANITLYAKWTIDNYTVTFNSQGGSAVSSKSVDYNSIITAPAVPTKLGYAFVGWYKEAGCITVWNFTTDKVTANTTLYAKWTINNYTVTFDSQGGSTVSIKSSDYNSEITAPTVPTKLGYAFVGWYKEAGCITAWNFTTDKVTANTTLYAKWTINNYTVTFDSQSGSTLSNKSADYNEAIAAPGSPTKTGYTFDGWHKEVGCINKWDFTTNKVTINITLYAKWKTNNYMVTFNSQGGSTLSNKSLDYNSAITAPTVPTKLGYAFVGWYKEAGCITAWNFTTDKVSANTILYAKWKIDNYGDINKDGVVDIMDIAEIASRYDDKMGEINWNKIYDLNHDGIVDIYDIVLVSKSIN